MLVAMLARGWTLWVVRHAHYSAGVGSCCRFGRCTRGDCVQRVLRCLQLEQGVFLSQRIWHSTRGQPTHVHPHGAEDISGTFLIRQLSHWQRGDGVFRQPQPEKPKIAWYPRLWSIRTRIRPCVLSRTPRMDSEESGACPLSDPSAFCTRVG